MSSFDIRNDISDPAHTDNGSRWAWLMVAAVMVVALVSFAVHVVSLQISNSERTRLADASQEEDVFPNGHELAKLMSSFTAPDLVKSDGTFPLSGKDERNRVVAGR
jgi:hypothetical protein